MQRTNSRRKPPHTDVIAYHHFGTEILETHVIVMTPSEWEQDRRSKEGTYCVMTTHGLGRELIIAVRPYVPSGTDRRLMDAYSRFDDECVAREGLGERRRRRKKRDE